MPRRKDSVSQVRKMLRQRLNVVTRKLSTFQRHPKHRQVLEDLACHLEITGPMDVTRLPARSCGFVVPSVNQVKYRDTPTAVVCQFQVVSMAVMYYWLYSKTEDDQDRRSCERYLDWLEEYVKCPERYAVIQGLHLEWYLYPYSGDPDDKPHVPEWVGEETL